MNGHVNGISNGTTNGATNGTSDGYVTCPGGTVRGERLLVRTVDSHAKEDPQRIWASIPHLSDLSQGFRDITFGELAQAVDYVAWYIEQNIGHSKENAFETITYMGISDIRYAVMVYAAIKCGYKTLLASVRNSTSGNLSLLNELNSSKFFCSSEFTSKASDLKKGKADLEVLTIPSFDDMVQGKAEHYPYEKNWEEARDDPIIPAQGAPKPIVLSNHYFAICDAQVRLHEVDGRRNLDYTMFDFKDSRDRFYSAFPPFHVAGIVALANVPVWQNSIVVLGPPEKPAIGQLASQIMDQVKIRAIFAPPTVVEQLMHEPEGVGQAASLEFVIFAGGPMSPSTGDALAKVTNVGQYIGSTEIGIIPSILQGQDTWNYFEWHPAFRCDMQHVAEDIYELVIPYHQDLEWIRVLCRGPIPKEAEWRTKDLFRPHPSKPNLWRFHGRTDDIIVLGNGEKFNPVTMEGIIQGHPRLSGALIVGQGRFQSALLVEPKEKPSDADAFIDEIWPFVKKANEDGPAHAQIFKSKVIIASPDKPFHRVGKGTVIRGTTAKDYTEEFEALYSGETQKAQGLQKLEKPDDLASLEGFIRAYTSPLLPGSKAINNTDDFFANGLDSLQTLELASGLRVALKPHYEKSDLSWISAAFIYKNPTAEILSRSLHKRLTSGSDGEEEIHDIETEVRRVARMKTLVDRYTASLPQKSSSICVALTGSTGTLGTSLLEALLEDPNVSKIYCLNRAADAQERHERSFKERSLDYDISPKSKVEFFQIEFGEPHFGLSIRDFSKLMADTDAIIHNAWKVNFNHRLESFDVHIRTVRNFIDWSLESSRHPHIHFISSISSVGSWSGHHEGPIPESPAIDYSIAQRLGYGESKHVSERILETAIERSDVNASILRVGQIAGPLDPKGAEWNRVEWLPSLVKSSKAMGCIPDSLVPRVDWIPVDELAHIIVDIVHSARRTRSRLIFNLVNPKASEWSDLVPAIQEYCGPATTKAIPFLDWINELKRLDPHNKEELAAKPSMKIIQFYEDMEKGVSASQKIKTTFKTDNGVSNSRTMAKLAPVDKAAMQLWLKQWNF
ncbi:MAG: putative NRPS-like protein biosynthetic cluster [Pycnora praestabilis]|nr:MAG: putative NRPS-like protein biosynthetic cluster [Pycnora praestabilis]